MKKIKPAYIGILLIFLMFGSTFAYAVIQSVSTPSQQSNQNPLPTGIIDYELSDFQTTELLRNGYTLMRYNYNITCVKCGQDRLMIEQLAEIDKFKNQIVVQELVSGNPGELTITSVYGQETLSDFVADDVIVSLCKLLVSPPVECAVLQFQNSSNSSATNSTS